jgi:valyl-tRNA synthetase
MMEKRFKQEIEKKWQEYWLREGTYNFDENDREREVYSIDTPPPFTSGELHMGHVLSYSYFDFVARFKRMNGFNVFYPQGWDTQGFPTEVKVEKKYGKGLSREEFREKCEEWTREMIKRMKQQMIEMGFSPDWRYEYKTMDPSYHEKVQRSLIEMYRKGEIYRAEHPVMWCPSCKSAIAKAETEDLERESLLNYIAFEDEQGQELLIATTRPELIPACVALLFNPEDERYKHLEGKKAKTPLGDVVPIIADKDVDKEFGTGLMMVCTFGDKHDVIWTYRYNLPIKIIVGKDGRFIPPAPDWMIGKGIEKGRETILERLKEMGRLVKQERKKQVVKVHDRCKTPVEFIPSMQWFAAVKKRKEEIKKWAASIRWVPSFGIHYLIDWLDNLDWDWVISRDRVFGTPLPFYYCPKCNATSPADELPFYPEKAKEKICEKCGTKMEPERAVADCWIDSSITPLIISDWPNLDERRYPSSLRPQGVEIVRTWAFYTIYRCGSLTGKAPFKTILLNGNVLAPDGKKMSKSLGNVISPSELKQQFPVDAIRQWAAMSGAMAKDRPFSYEDIKFAKHFLTKLWNSARFISLVAPEPVNLREGQELALFDRWILNKLNMLIKFYTEKMDAFEFHHAIAQLHDFYWHSFCDNYIEIVKHRVYGKRGKESAQFALRTVLYKTIKLLAPITPHISEEIYHVVFNAPEGKSIHLSQWPKPLAIEELSDGEEKAINFALSVISELRRAKAKHGLSMKHPVERLVIVSPTPLPEDVVDDIKGVAKIREMLFEKGKGEGIKEIVFSD